MAVQKRIVSAVVVSLTCFRRERQPPVEAAGMLGPIHAGPDAVGGAPTQDRQHGWSCYGPIAIVRVATCRVIAAVFVRQVGLGVEDRARRMAAARGRYRT